jgi:hypothetical protein
MKPSSETHDSREETLSDQLKMDPKKIAKRLEKELVKLRKALARIEETKSVSREALDFEINS